MVKELKCIKCGSSDHVFKRSGLCLDCWGKHMQSCVNQMREKRGPIYDKWLAAMARKFGH